MAGIWRTAVVYCVVFAPRQSPSGHRRALGQGPRRGGRAGVELKSGPLPSAWCGIGARVCALTSWVTEDRRARTATKISTEPLGTEKEARLVEGLLQPQFAPKALSKKFIRKCC
jgi:hypothetical protein